MLEASTLILLKRYTEVFTHIQDIDDTEIYFKKLKTDSLKR